MVCILGLMMEPSAYARLSTEKINPSSRNLDRLKARDIVRLMNREERRVLWAVTRAENAIVRTARLAAQAFRAGRRLYFAGAGTSGRLGVLEAAECPPTFGTPPSQVQALMAGGRGAVFESKEGAEDSRALARRDSRSIRRGDVVVGIAASGVTDYARTVLQVAQNRGAKTILMTCNPRADLKGLDVRLVLDTGPEVLAGSTRLKAATACKLALNRITLASMVLVGKVYGNRMVDLQPKSRKLRARGLRLVEEIGQVTPKTAKTLFHEARQNVKTALVMAKKGGTASQARQRLLRVNGSLRRALA